MAKSSNVVRPTSLTKVIKRYGERLGSKFPTKASGGVEKLSYIVRVFETRTVEVIGHILSVDADRVQIHNLRKSGSTKTDVSFFNMSDVVTIEGKKGELGRLTVRRKTLIEEYKDVQIKTAGKVLQLTDANGDQVVINTNIEGVDFEIAADADALASGSSKKKAAKKETKKVVKKSAKKKSKKSDDDDEF